MSRADWAVYDYVRAGIEAKSRLSRVKEEREQLKLHARRMTCWLLRQSTALLRRDFIIPERVWSSKLIHRLRVVQSLLEMEGAILCPEDRVLLSELKDHIVQAIDPFNIAVTWPEQLADHNRVEDGVAESEYSQPDEDQLDHDYEDDNGIAEAMERLEMQEAAMAAVDAVLAQADSPELRDDDEEEALQDEDIDAMRPDYHEL
jgi:hypothetical protein